MEEIFDRANLRVYKRSARLQFHPEYYDVLIWALY